MSMNFTGAKIEDDEERHEEETITTSFPTFIVLYGLWLYQYDQKNFLLRHNEHHKISILSKIQMNSKFYLISVFPESKNTLADRLCFLEILYAA